MSLELSYQQTEELLECIINNKKLVQVDSRNGKVFIVLSYPSSQEILLSRYTRAAALLEAEKEGLPSRAEIAEVIDKRGIINEEDREKIKELENKLVAQRRLLSLTKISARRKTVEETISRLSQEIEHIKSQGDNLYTLTREYRADEVALLYMAWASTYTVGGEKWWSSFHAFESETDLLFRSSTITQYAMFNQGLSVAEVRFAARHVLWRIRYTAALKIGGPLFPQGLYDLTPDQQSLLYWSNYYQSIYEMLPDDRPADDIIQNDEELDAYMESYFKNAEKERNEGRLKRGARGSGRLTTQNSDEIIVTANHPDYLSTVYSDKRIGADEKTSEVEVISPHGRRAQNRRAARMGR